jgi:hypothetical protein
MVKLLTSQGGCKGVIEQSLMSTAMGSSDKFGAENGFGLIELELPVESRQHLTQYPHFSQTEFKT